MEELKSFVAIDFETATPQRMPCQIGICVVEDLQIVDTYCALIQPPNNEYSKRNSNVHGIKPQDTANAPTFDQLWDEIRPYLEGRILVAHNAAFDLSVLETILEHYGLESPDVLGWACTYEMTGRPLRSIMPLLDLGTDKHHDALVDAIACAKLLIMILQNEDAYFTKQLKHDKEVAKSKFKCTEAINGVRFVLSGIFLYWKDRENLAQLIKDSGGLVATSVSKRTNYLVVGDTPGPSKLETATSIGTEIITEAEFIERFCTPV